MVKKESVMTIALRPEHEELIHQAIEAGLIHNADEVFEAGLESLRKRLGSCLVDKSQRQAAVRRMQEFGERHRLSLGEPLSAESTKNKSKSTLHS
jgi:Arc/MetJ-type ribon-helix-helix transcriptional regulator